MSVPVIMVLATVNDGSRGCREGSNKPAVDLDHRPSVFPQVGIGSRGVSIRHHARPRKSWSSLVQSQGYCVPLAVSPNLFVPREDMPWQRVCETLSKQTYLQIEFQFLIQLDILSNFLQTRC